MNHLRLRDVSPRPSRSLMSFLRYIIAVTRENPLYVYLLFALVMAFVLTIGALISTL